MRLTLLAFATLAGCAAPRGAPPGGLVGDYTLGYPDAVRVEFAGHPKLDAAATVGLDGSLPLGPLGEIPAAGSTLGELAGDCARLAALPADRVAVTLADARSGRVYLVGPENRARRAVAYVGPERVTALLARVGALRPGYSELRDVTVTRHVLVSGLPELVWRVDVAAVLAGDPATDLVLEPSDVVEVGETRRSKAARNLPDWARPAFLALVGMGPDCPAAQAFPVHASGTTPGASVAETAGTGHGTVQSGAPFSPSNSASVVR